MCDELQKTREFKIALWKLNEDAVQWTNCLHMPEAMNQTRESLIKLTEAFQALYKAVRAAA